jgi:hypothetical protein
MNADRVQRLAGRLLETPIPATPENIQKAKEFVLGKWRERASEYGFEEPANLESACKFSSMFAQRVFGGRLEGNWDHQYLVLHNGRILDLTEGVGLDVEDSYLHDEDFWGNEEHEESMQSCLPRVERWVAEFKQRIEKSS